jgi:hypothetical protein
LRLVRLKTVRAAALALAPALASCAPAPPIALTEGYSGPSRAHTALNPLWTYTPCRVRIDAVLDARPSSDSMGEIGGRPVGGKDTVGWLRSGLLSLSDESRIRFVETDPPDLILRVELLKAYLLSEAQLAKTANVVVRVRYSDPSSTQTAPPDEVVYRGHDNGVNWLSSSGESQAELNSALSQILDRVGSDIASRCRGKS